MYEVFIAEDEPPIADMIAEMVDAGPGDFHAAVVAHDGGAMLDILGKRRPDLLLADIQMPAMDGLRLIEAARAIHPNLVCVILTSHAEFDYVQTALRQGAFDYILKTRLPDSLDAVLRRVAAFLEQQERERIADVGGLTVDPSGARVSQDGESVPHADAAQAALQLKEFLDRQTDQPFNLKANAIPGGYNELYLARVFKANFGISPKRYHTRAKIALVIARLTENPHLLLKEAAALVGYDDELYLAKVFKQETGKTYTKYRSLLTNTR